MKPRKNKDSFWLSYSDLMTSLFFIMLVLFVVCTAKMSGLVNLPDDVKELREELLAVRKENKSLKNENETLCDKVNQQQEILDGYQATQEQYERILLIQNMFKSLTEGKTLEYREAQRTFVAKAFEDKEIFKPKLPEFDFGNLPMQDIIQVGKDLEDILKELNRQNPDCSYQLVIEGTTANYYDAEKRVSADAQWPYKLSYERALALYNLWRNNSINLRKYNTEILICGSGMNGANRDKAKEDNNKRIVIQIIPKFDRI